MTEAHLLDQFLEAIQGRWRPTDTSALLGLFRGLVTCRVDDCARTASGVYDLGELRLPLCPHHLVQIAMGREARRTR